MTSTRSTCIYSDPGPSIGNASWRSSPCRQTSPGAWTIHLRSPHAIVAGRGYLPSFPPARLRRHGPQGPAVRLLPGGGDELIRLAALVRPLVELHWTRMLAYINNVATVELD